MKPKILLAEVLRETFTKFDKSKFKLIMIDAKQTDIFISYRRVDGREHARTIQLALGREGYQNIFFDYDSMRDGMFNDQILTAISHCKDFILILSPQSMIRCANEGDWVAREIQAAIESGCKIIPVQINDPFTNWPADLPRKFNFIKQIEFLTLRTDEYFDASIKRLVSWLDSKPCTGSSQSTSDKFTLKITVDETCELHIDGHKLRKIKAGKSVSIENVLKSGKTYDLTFVSLARKASSYSIQYTCSETVLFGSVDVSFAEMREQEKLAARLEKERIEDAWKRYKEREMVLQAACELYDEASFESDGMTAVMKNNKIGFLNSNCFESIPCIYDNVSVFCNGYATVCLDNKWGIIDKYGQIVIPFKSDVPCYECGNYEYFICAVNKRLAISTIENGFPETFPYEDIIAIDKHADLFFVKQGGLWKMVNASGGEVPFKATAQAFNMPYAVMPNNNELWFRDDWKLQICPLPVGISHPQTGKYAYLNSKLEMTIPFVDEGSGHNTGDENIIIKTNGKMSLVNPETGTTIIPPTYDDICQIFYGYWYNLYYVSNDAQWDQIDLDSNRQVKIPAKLRGGRQGVLDQECRIIVPQIYQAIEIADGENGHLYFIAYQLKRMETSYVKATSGDILWLKYNFDESSSIVDIYTLEGELIKRLTFKEYLSADWSKIVN